MTNLGEPCAYLEVKIAHPLYVHALIAFNMMQTKANDFAMISALNNQGPAINNGDSVRRRGSLPFKKRRLFCAPPPLWEQTPQCTNQDQSTGSVTPSPYNSHNDARIAALALVAAASVCFPLNLSAPTESQVEGSTESNNGTSSLPLFNENQERSNPLHSVEPFGPPPVTPTGFDSDATQKPLSESNSRRVHHPPLAAPLPGGCHGRTSRNNSYCRRQPCYNGSNYCKLHYQQLLVSGPRATSTDVNLSEKNVQSESSTPVPPNARQDKRYTGCDDEVRCLATTTRGRPCAYVAVSDSKYCYLHADYDTNPPPRRGGSGSTPKQVKFISTPQGDLDGCPPLPDLSHAEVPFATQPEGLRHGEGTQSSSASDDSCSVASSRSDADKSKPSPQLIKCPHPLLSSISSDQWSDKYVLIGLGPLVNRVGKIMKWGNGWVSVRIQSGDNEGAEGGLLHNRRSVELFLLPPDLQKEYQQNEENEQNDESEDSRVIKRCISREPDEPVSSDISGQDHVEMDAVFDGKESLKEVSSSSDNSSEEPAIGEHSNLIAETEEDQEVTPSRSEKSDGVLSMDEGLDAVKCRDNGADTDKDAATSYLTLVTSEALTPAPLSECLFQAQHGLISKSKMGLLFGTAALERGRRTVHKPKRYEDIALNTKSPRSPRRTKG